MVKWNAYNPDYTTGTVGFFPFAGNAASINSVNDFTGAADGGVLEVRTEGASWVGEMNVGDGVLFFHNDYSATSSVFHISFATAVRGFALQAQSNAFGNYAVNYGVWDGAFPGSNPVTFGSTTGTNSGSRAGTQGWMGAYDPNGMIKDVYIQVTMTDGSATSGSGFGPLYVEAVPEPATMAALGLGALALMRRRRQSA